MRPPAHSSSMHLIRAALSLALLLISYVARAETLQAPVGGKSISLGDARVACGAPGGGWTLEGNGHALRPPTAETAIGHSTDLKIAADAGGCASSKATL